MSSYKGKFGFVQYDVKALMERPHQPTIQCKKAFEVEEPLDVNTPDLLVSSLLTYHYNEFNSPLEVSLTGTCLLSLRQVA